MYVYTLLSVHGLITRSCKPMFHCIMSTHFDSDSANQSPTSINPLMPVSTITQTMTN